MKGIGRLLPPHIRASGSTRVWAFNAVLALLALLATAGLAGEPMLGPFHLAWWLVALGFCASEATVVHVHFRNGAHSFSVSEIPLVVGVYFLSPVELILAQLVGSALALHFYRRQAPLKLVFNLSKFCVETCLLLVFVHLLIPSDPMAPAAWLLVLAGLAGVVMVGTAATATAMSLLDGQLRAEGLGRLIGFGVSSSIANGAVGLAAVAVMWWRPGAALLLVPPAALLVIAYRAYISERRKRQDVGFLYGASRRIHEAGDAPAIVEMLEDGRRVFRAEVAELVVREAPDGARASRVRVGPGEGAIAVESVDWDPRGALAARVLGSRAPVLVAPDELGPLREDARARGFRDAVLSGLFAEEQPLGMLLFANRRGELGSFDAQDLELLETLAVQTSAALARQRLQEQLRRLAFHDPLTGLGNRSFFVERLAEASRDETSMHAVLLCDLDDFRSVNDSLGHQAGDRLLAATAARIGETLGGRATVARSGGDEFAVLVEGVSGQEEAEAMAEEIRAALRMPLVVAGESLLVRSSIGIVLAGPGRRHPDDVLRDADVAMYTAKAGGKSRHALYDPRVRDRLIQRHQVKVELERAVEERQFTVHYQPMVELASGRPVGLEALVRWNHPQWGLVTPDRFIRLAEESGLIVPLGLQVLELALGVARSLRGAGADAFVSVNLSERQVREPDFVASVEEVVARSGVERRRLVLEMTESAFVLEPDTIAKIEALRAFGIRFALDDFGTGYSSLSALQGFPVDAIKIAKPFVDRLDSPGAEAPDGFARAVLELGATLELVTIAEGIETVSQLEHLRGIGSDWGQGFLFSPAVPESEVQPLLRTLSRSGLKLRRAS